MTLIEDEPPKRLNAEQARAKARECRALAKVAFDKSNSTMLNSIAQTWDLLAEKADEKL